MKALLSILLGFMLLTSLVGISYATPVMLPLQGSGDINACVNLTPNNPNYVTLGCAGAAHQGGDENPPQHNNCNVGRIGSNTFCCESGITPHSLDVSDIHPDLPCVHE